MRILIGEISSYKAIVIARHIRAAYPSADEGACGSTWVYQSGICGEAQG